jgi:hypothetical protein
MGGKRAKKNPTLRRVGFVGLALERAVRWLVVGVAILLERDRTLNVIGKGMRFDKIATRQIFVTLYQVSMRNLREFAPIFDDVSVEKRFDAVVDTPVIFG